MSSIFGVFDKNAHDLPVEWNELMLNACAPWPRDRESNIHKGACFLSCLQRYNTPQSPLAKQPYSETNSLYLVFDGRLDNRVELAQLLKLPFNDKTTDETLIFEAFQKWNTEIGKYLLGDFCIAIYDSAKHALFVIRDHLGVRPLFIASNDNHFAFASNKAALLALPWVKPQMNEQWLADFLTVTKVDYHTTFYLDIESFSPAHWLLLSSNKQEDNTEIYQRYWQLDFDYQLPEMSEVEYISQFKSLLFESVKCRLRTYGEPASELSGGLDSTSIAAIAATLLEKKTIHAYSHVMSEETKGKVFPYDDESDYMKELVNLHSNIKHYPVTSNGLGIIGAIKYSMKIHSGPTRNDLSQFGDDLFGQVKNNGHRTILSGFGGDQLVTSSGSGWNEELVRNGQWRLFISLAASLTENWRQFLKILISSIAVYKFGVKDRAKKRFEKSWPDYIAQLGVERYFVEQQGYPKRYYDNPTRKHIGNIKQREYDVINSPHVLYRLEDSAVGAASYGVDYRYPLLDIRLLQFCLAYPSKLKVTNGVKRNMIRQAMIGILPDKIRLRHDKSRATIPTVFQRILIDIKSLKKVISTSKDYELVSSYIHTKYVEDCLINIAEQPNNSTGFNQKIFIRTIAFLLWQKVSL
ncbi:asparagine synthase-related protein [Aliikangiella sp. IMCC44359]|uniref:asparagine synthase-related protein n=1 Tax=Aliikangiella sp. IMCC44359 TaxID=3459125 RepID=UPI00403A904E